MEKIDDLVANAKFSSKNSEETWRTVRDGAFLLNEKTKQLGLGEKVIYNITPL